MTPKSSITLLLPQAESIAPRIAAENAIPVSITAMNVKDARRIRLGELKEEVGTLKEIASRITASSPRKTATRAKNKGYLDRYLSQIYTGGRGMGDRLARKIETTFNKSEGWMDHVGASSAEVNELLNIWKQFPELEQRRILEELRIRLRVLKSTDFDRIDPVAASKRLPRRLS